MVVRLIAIAAALLATLLAPAAAPASGADPLATGEHQVVADGVRLWYRVAGRGRGAPVLFLHGGPGQGSQSFATIAGPELERSHRMIYLDQRGSGRSERPWDRAYSLALLVEDVEALRRTLRVPKFSLIGHSVGSIVAMEYGARYPDRVDRIVLAAAGPDLPAAFNLMCDRVASADPGAYARAVAARSAGSNRKCNMWGDGVFTGAGMQRFVNGNMFPRRETQALVEAADRANGLRNTGELSRAMIEQGLLDYRFAHPERLLMPVLVIAGTRDFQAAIEPQQALVALLPHGRLLAYGGAGHFMWAEDPVRFARDVGAFLAGMKRR